MTTLPPEQPPQAHQQRQVAESFGTDAARYDRARPSYPGALVDRIVAASPGREVLDVGIGTGIAARQFQQAGCRVRGVDPDARMAELAKRSGLEVDVATFEAWDPAGREFDAVIAAQSWHWVDPAAGAAKAAQALRPGGRLAVFWNAMQLPASLNEAIGAAFRQARPWPDTSRGLPGVAPYLAMCATAAEGIKQSGAFGEPEQWRFDWDRSYARDEWLDQLPTFGGLGTLPPATLAGLTAAVGAAIDAVGGSFTMNYATMVSTAVRSGTP